ncbi:MAG: hypothetical protein R3305_11135 [Gammaproteobacteria bacterium]|nr:hypothetical protein [Gammaproteobacteria bacterium]
MIRTLVAGAALACIVAAPSSAQDRPDFTGVWTTYRNPAALGGTNRGGSRPSLTPLAQQKVDAYQAVTQGTNHSPGAYCVGGGMPGSMLGSGGYPMEILQHPDQINIVYEAHKEIRRVYLRELDIDHEEIFPERNGFSVGYWEGDTLVVETDRLVEQVDTAYPHSEQAKIVERYSMTTEDGRRVLTAEMTMTDPLFLTEPFTTVKRWQEVPGGRLLNYECTEPQWLDIVDRLLAGEEIGYEGE